MIDQDRLELLDRSIMWTPQPGPQLDAFLSEADELFYGGAAGGGKTALAMGLAVTVHTRTLFIREEGKQLLAVKDELTELLGSRDGYNGQEDVWRLPSGRQIQFGGIPNLGDERKFQGNPRDLLVLDEAANLLEAQVEFLTAWSRTKDAGQRCRILFCSNPPQDADGEWLIRRFAPWLDPSFPKPAKPGELRWVAKVPQKNGGAIEQWVDGPAAFTAPNGEEVHPISRTFIPSLVTDNAYYRDTDYMRRLQALPEPLRSQMLKGDFAAGRVDDEWQVIPAAWVKAAMARWKPDDPAGQGEISSVGVDPSRGGDEMIIARRRGWRFDELIAVDPAAASHGGTSAKKVLDVAGDSAPVHVDVIGYGASTADHLQPYLGRRLVPVNFANHCDLKDQTGNFRFLNVRAAAWWRMREILAPERIPRVALPNDQRLFADLTAPRYRLGARGVQIEDKEDIKGRLGRSPDRGDAVVLAAFRVAGVLVDHNARRRSVRRSPMAQFPA